jgi:hypothetical protein
VLPGAGSGPSAWLVAAVIVGAVVLGGLLGWGGWRAWEWWTRRDPMGSAFAKMARALRLTRAERGEIAALAERSGVPAAVLLVSASARETALRKGRLGAGGA